MKQPFYITRSDGVPLTFAGLWEKWKDGLLSCAILTTDVGDITRDIHGRMPLMLDQGRDREMAWGRGAGAFGVRRTKPAIPSRLAKDEQAVL